MRFFKYYTTTLLGDTSNRAPALCILYLVTVLARTWQTGTLHVAQTFTYKISKLIKIEILLLSFILGLTGCISPQKSLEKKQYDRAFKLAFRKRNKADFHESHREALMTALRKIVSRDSAEMESHTKTPSVDNYQNALMINENLQEKIQKSAPYTDGVFAQYYDILVYKSNYYSEMLSHYYFRDGINQLEEFYKTRIKLDARWAYDDFIGAKKYGNIHPHLDSLINKCAKLAQVIYFIKSSSIFNLSYSWEIDHILDDLSSYSSRFKKVSYGRYPSHPEDVDCYITIEFSPLDIHIEEDEEIETVEDEIKTTETVTNSDGVKEKVEITTKIYATLITTKVIKTATWDIDIRVNGSINCNVSGTGFEVSTVSEIEKTGFEGDERAVPPGFGSMIEKKLMSDDEMADELFR